MSDDRVITLKWYQSHGFGGSANDFLKMVKKMILKLFVNDFENCL